MAVPLEDIGKFHWEERLGVKDVETDLVKSWVLVWKDMFANRMEGIEESEFS